MRSVITVFFLFTAGFLHGQDLTGIWQGHFRSSSEPRSALYDDRYKFEVQIAQHDRSLQAITYSYLSSIFYGKAEATGTINPKTGKVLIQEGKLIEIRMSTGGGACTMTCFLQYSKSGGEEFLEGSFGSMNTQDSTNCGRGTILLRRVINSDFYKEPFVAKREKEIAAGKKAKVPAPAAIASAPHNSAPHNSAPHNIAVHTTRQDSLKRIAMNRAGRQDSLVKKTIVATKSAPSATHPRLSPPARASIVSVPSSGTQHDTEFIAPSSVPEITPEVLASRANELVQTITVNTEEVTLNIYDDGAIDNDTITVFLDKKMVVAHAMLTDQPIIVTLHMDESHNYHEVVMVADNEGTIPPNTSLMIVKAGDKQYEVRITSTEQKNAVVLFKYEKAN